ALLGRVGLSGFEAARVADLVRPWADLDRLGPLVVRHARSLGGSPDRIEIALDADRTVRLALRGARWSARLDSVPVTSDTVVLTGRVASNLFAAELGESGEALSLPEKAELPGLLAGVYEWQIDFYRDVRPGDAFRLALVRERRPDGSVRGSRVLAAEYLNRGRLFAAYRFPTSADGEIAFYDRGGTALRGAFLRSPLAYARVTSRFDGARDHPLLGRYRAHEGVDYGAPRGTPVRATGDGTVSEAGWRGEYGLMVELRHGRGLETRYAHLSSIADGVRPGARVEQGALLGHVGSTGLSTAPHLHYEFRIHGRATDPTGVNLPVERVLEEADRARFDRARATADTLLSRRPWPTVTRARGRTTGRRRPAP
ncbi:MAG: M23 family metallopeptidase, partial [Gemmatimonadota bacterium]